MSAEEHDELSGFAASRSLPHALVSRAKLVLWSGDGLSNSEIAKRLDWSKATVGKWRQRFIQHRIQGLYDELRPGRPRTISDERVASLLRRTLKSAPPAGTHWSVRQAAETNRLSKSTVHRVFQTFALQPHRTNSRNRSKSQDGRKLHRYRRRWKVERLFAWLQNFRRLVTRWEYHIENFLGFVHLGCLKLLLSYL